MPEQPQPRDLSWLQASTAATITVAATAEILDVDERTVLRGVAGGQLPSVPVGRRVLIPRLPLLAMLVGQQDGGSGSPAA